MITRIIGQLTPKMLETLIQNLTPEGRKFVKVLLADEHNHINALNLDIESEDIRKLVFKRDKSAEEERLIQSSPKVWMGRVYGKKTKVSKETLDAVNTHLKTYTQRYTRLDARLKTIQDKGEVFFGVPMSKHLRDYKVFKKLLLRKTLDEPVRMHEYINEFLEATNTKTVHRPFEPTTSLSILAKSLDEKLFLSYQKELEGCIVSSMHPEVISMIETILLKSSQADNLFNKTVWEETQDLLPIFHNQHLRYTFHFFSLFLVNAKTSVLPRNMSKMSIVALIRKVAELC